MSFRCEKCKVAQPPGARPHRVVTKTRSVDRGRNTPLSSEIAEEQNHCDQCVGVVSGEKESSQAESS